MWEDGDDRDDELKVNGGFVTAQLRCVSVKNLNNTQTLSTWGAILSFLLFSSSSILQIKITLSAF